MYTIGQLVKQLKLSRSTILYYEQQGLISPTTYTASGYRLYNQEAITTFKKILSYRQAGLSLADIKYLKNKKGKDYYKILEKRLTDINNEIQELREQQRLLVTLLRNKNLLKQTRALTKSQWVNILRASGLNDHDMWRWHQEFEKASPQAHQDFLEALGIPKKEITTIRKKCKSS